MPVNLVAVLDNRAAQRGWGDDVAFVAGDRSVTHGEVYAGAGRAAAVLSARGVGRGDRVLLVLPDGLAFVHAFLGAIRMGAVAVPVNPRLIADDHRAAADAADASVVVCGPDLAPRFGGRVVLAPDDLDAHTDGPADLAPVGPGDAAYGQFTSGTTGAPKLVVHAHGHPLVYGEAFAGPAVALGRDDVVLSVSKLYFAYGLGNSLFFPLLTGCRAVLHADHPRPDEIADLVERHRVTVLFAVPTFYAHLVATDRSDAVASVRVAVSAGEALGVELAARARAFLGCPVLDGLGSTEVGQTFASNTLSVAKEATVGRALPPYRVEVRDDGGRPQPTGEAGVVWVAGPTLPLGHEGEWLCTNDRGLLDDEGFLHLRGRADDVEQVGGISVSPQEVEAVLGRHPAVTEVAVAGVVDADGASHLQAFVVSPAATEDVAAELLTMARADLAPFKVPRTVTFVETLPRTSTGKLRRFVLRQSRPE